MKKRWLATKYFSCCQLSYFAYSVTWWSTSITVTAGPIPTDSSHIEIISALGFRQTRQDDQECRGRERGVDSRGVEEEIREGEGEKLEVEV